MNPMQSAVFPPSQAGFVQGAAAGLRPQSMLTQQEYVSESDREAIGALIEEFCRDERYDVLLENPQCEYMIYIPFVATESNPFRDRWGRCGILLLSPCPPGELMLFSRQPVPATILAYANVAPLEVVEKARGVLGMPICIPGGGSEWHVQQIRHGRLNPVGYFSETEVQIADKFWDKVYLSERIMDKLITIFKAFVAKSQNIGDVMTMASSIAEQYIENAVIGQGGGKLKMTNKTLLILIGIGAAVVVGVAAYYFATRPGGG